MKYWYLIQTKPQQEAIATLNLSDQGYTVFHPKVIIKGKNIPLFPRYLFIQLDDKTQNWAPIRSTKGVSNFVRFGLNFAKVPYQIIDLIKAQQQTIGKIIDLTSHHQGDTVEIQTSAFRGQHAIFQNYNTKDRVIVLLNLIGQHQKITLDEREVVAV